MAAEVLTPGVQHAGQADLRLEALLAEGEQRLARGAEKQVIERALVALHERVQLMRQREDHMKVRDRQQPPHLLRQPVLRQALLALRAEAAD